MVESIFYAEALKRVLKKVNADKVRLKARIIKYRLAVPLETRKPDLSLFQPKTEAEKTKQAEADARACAIEAKCKIQERKYWAKINKKAREAEEEISRLDCGDAYDQERDEGRVFVNDYYHPDFPRKRLM
jgi:hypothetical protein